MWFWSKAKARLSRTIHFPTIITNAGPSECLVGAVSYSSQLLAKSEFGEGSPTKLIYP